MDAEAKRALAALALQERKRKEVEDKRYHVLLIIAALGFVCCLLLLAVQVMQLTGKASSISAQGGYITEVILTQHFPTAIWGGFYGVAMRFPGFTQQLSKDLKAGTIERSDIFFDCIKQDATGGPEIYASLNSTLDFSDVQPLSPAVLDEITGCSGAVYCAVNTFTKTMSIYLGSDEITNIPAVYSYKYGSSGDIFDVGLLNVSGKIAFVSHINATIQNAYNPEYIVNYQMLLPTPENTTQKYYFFTDPFDTCPAGGVGNTISANVYGYARNNSGSLLPNVTVTVAGYSTQTDENGFYNLSMLVVPGTYNIIGQKTDYKVYVNYTTITFAEYNIEHNITMVRELPYLQGETMIKPKVYGTVKDPSDFPIEGAGVYIGNVSMVTNNTGEYELYPTITIGQHPLIALKEQYNNFVVLINFTENVTIYNYNITLTPANENIFPTGPYPQGPYTTLKRSDIIEVIRQEVIKQGEDFWLSTKVLKRQVRQNTFIEEHIGIYNFKGGPLRIVATISPELTDIIALEKNALSVPSNSPGDLPLIIYGKKPLGKYKGKIYLRGDIEKEIDVEIDIVEKKLPIESVLMKLNLFRNVVSPGSTLRYSLELQNLLTEQSYKVELRYLLMDRNETKIFLQDREEVELKNSLTILKTLDIPKNISEDKYTLRVDAFYFDTLSSVSAPLTIAKPLYLYSFFGIPLWIIFVLIALMSFFALNMFLYRLHMEKKKRYHLKLDTELLPKTGPRSIKIGKIAETNIPAFLDLDALTVHGIVAGATGGGKSITAQVIVEEALAKNIAVIVFDPTAQWSGMLRKCEDKRMLSMYPKFGLKPTDARGFPGNIHLIKNARQAIDIKKYISPGQIQVFALNKLDPSEMDTFVSSAIVSIFRSGPEEHPGLRTLMVFDEVHRLLPKFGGTGKGFLQIERSCREFRKWGYGVLLVSQVLSDFVGEIKANINTEMLMRVAEENDLARVKERYGPDALKSLVRADVGTGMVQNAEYNRGMPYFVSFRPILHNTRRLSDDILEKYNAYNDIIEDFEYQIEQLEQEKVDTFDLKMELKLVKDKLMTGNFTVVDIYLEGLKPRMEKEWQRLGKKPKKKELELIAENELNASFAAAAKDRAAWEQKQQKEAAAAAPEKKEDLRKKIVRPLTFDNGMMVSSLQELADILPTLGDDIFKIHVNKNKNKNDIAKWVSEFIDPALGEKVQSLAAKNEIAQLIKTYDFNAPPAADTKKVQQQAAPSTQEAQSKQQAPSGSEKTPIPAKNKSSSAEKKSPPKKKK